MKALFITALDDLQILGALGRGLHLWPHCFLTNDKVHVKSLVTQNFEILAGKLETGHLKESKAVVYEVLDVEAKRIEDVKGVELINVRLSLLQLFLSCLWLVKDNSVNFELGFLESPHRGMTVNVTSNSRSVRFSSSKGVFNKTDFSADELRAARNIFQKLYGGPTPEKISRNPVISLPDLTNRFERVMYFVQTARSASELSIKVAQYVTCLECLFCTDSSELSHKMSERAALFLATSKLRRLELYNELKSAYAVRSRVVHGDRLPAKYVSLLPRICEQLDQVLREAVYKIVTSEQYYPLFTGRSEELERFFLEIVLAKDERQEPS